MPNPILLASLNVLFKAMARFEHPAPPWDPASVRSIVLINTTALGDTLFSTPAIRAIRGAFPKAKIIALVSPTAKEVLLYNPHLNGIIDHPGRVNLPFFFRLPSLLRKIRQEAFDVAVVLHGNDPDAVPLAYLSGATYRFGLAKSRLAFLLTHPFAFDIPDTHYIHMWLTHLKGLGISFKGEEMEIFLSREEEDAAERILVAQRLSPGRIVGIHPFANKLRDKLWSFDRVVELGAAIVREGYTPLLFGGLSERKVAEEMAEQSEGRMISLAGRLTLRQTMALIKRCVLFISVDSGPLHVAQALGVPTVALFGPSDPKLTGPLLSPAVVVYNKWECSPCGWRPCPYQVACMDSIGVEDVVNAARSLLKRSEEGRSPVVEVAR